MCRQCSSGLQAVADVAAAIKAGYYTIGIAAGVESMTSNPMDWKAGVNPRVAENKDAANCMLPMGQTPLPSLPSPYLSPLVPTFHLSPTSSFFPLSHCPPIPKPLSHSLQPTFSCPFLPCEKGVLWHLGYTQVWLSKAIPCGNFPIRTWGRIPCMTV